MSVAPTARQAVQTLMNGNAYRFYLHSGMVSCFFSWQFVLSFPCTTELSPRTWRSTLHSASMYRSSAIRILQDISILCMTGTLVPAPQAGCVVRTSSASILAVRSASAPCLNRFALLSTCFLRLIQCTLEQHQAAQLFPVRYAFAIFRQRRVVSVCVSPKFQV